GQVERDENGRTLVGQHGVPVDAVQVDDVDVHGVEQALQRLLQDRVRSVPTGGVDGAVFAGCGNEHAGDGRPLGPDQDRPVTLGHECFVQQGEHLLAAAYTVVPNRY